MKILRTTSKHIDFKNLVKDLDAYLAIQDGDEHAFYDQFNKIDMLQNVVVCYYNDIAVGCGAFKPYENASVEVKRMYTKPEYRGKGIATKVLSELERWAKELNYATCVLETGTRQPEAISLYQNKGYKRIENYGQYAGVENSLCFEKSLNN